MAFNEFIRGNDMSEASEVLDDFFKSVEYSSETNLNVSKVDRDLYYLLKSHAVIDRDTIMASKTALNTAGGFVSKYLETLDSELSRISETKGE